MKKNTAIILQHSGGELANQLWNYISIFAYAKERDLECYNPSFFEYAHYFKHVKSGSLFINSFFYLPFKNHDKRRGSKFTQFFRLTYKIYVLIIKTIYKRRLVSTKHGTRESVNHLPPTQESKIINQLERTGDIYFDGWLFRNPKGIRKFHDDILKEFAPQKNISDRVQNIINPLRKEFQFVVGVHIRQGDYRTFKRGKYFVDQGRVREVLDEFLSVYKISSSKTVFFIASDGPIDNVFFKGLNTYVSGENAPVDMFTLSSTDVIIGSDSTFGDFASYYGNIPHIVCTREEIDWKYYLDKSEFFENKYSTMVHY